ncbi:MAG: RNA chaperone Hfq [Armatimonadetes bacterium]|nr:RNA chaperone Hfq [Armatimonadota bacterium]
MAKTQLNLQDMFLNQVRKDNTPVTIYLANSVQLRGVVRGFDAFTVLLESPGRPTQLVYKHSVTSIVPMRPVTGLGAEIGRELQQQAAEQAKPAEAAEAAEPVAPEAS